MHLRTPKTVQRFSECRLMFGEHESVNEILENAILINQNGVSYSS